MKKYSAPFYLFFLVLWLLFLLIPCYFWLNIIFGSSNYANFYLLVQNQFYSSFYSNHLETYFLSELFFLAIKNEFWMYVLLIMALTISNLYLLFELYKKKKKEVSVSLHGSLEWTHFVPLVLLTLGWVGYKCFLYTYLPLHIDEVFDFIYYTRNDFITRHSYQFTNGVEWFNSHVLYTDVSACFLGLGSSDKLSIRIPSIIAELMLFYTIFRMSNNDHKFKFIFVILVVLLSFWQGLYSVEGRSYLFASLFSVLSFKALIDFKERNSINHLLLYVVAVLLGIASNKLFVLPFIGSVVYGLLGFKEWSIYQKRSLLMALILIVNLSVLFYMPTLLISGVNNVIPFGGGNSLIQKYPLLIESISVITNVNSKSYLVILLVIGLVVFFRNRFSKQTIEIQKFFVIQVFVYVLYTLISGDYLPFRTLVYLNTWFSIALAFSVFDVFVGLKRGRVLVMSLSVMLLFGNLVYNFKNGWVNKLSMFITGNEFYTSLNSDVDQIGGGNPTKLWIQEDLHFLLFYSKLKYPNETVEFENVPLLGRNEIIISPVELDVYTGFSVRKIQENFIYNNN